MIFAMYHWHVKINTSKHKIILSSCSPVLKSILKLNHNQHPLIYLRRVKYIDLKSLITFMYQGEVNVAEEDLADFLQVAEDLKIRGLYENNKGFVPIEDHIYNQSSQKNIVPSSGIKDEKHNQETYTDRVNVIESSHNTVNYSQDFSYSKKTISNIKSSINAANKKTRKDNRQSLVSTS